MKGYQEILAHRVNGHTLDTVWVYVDVVPLLNRSGKHLKTFPLGVILIDPMDTQSGLQFHALNDLIVQVQGQHDRIVFIGNKILAAKPRAMVLNDGKNMELFRCIH